MKFDEAAVRMAYDAARDNFLRFYSHVRAAPPELAPKFHEAYLRGYDAGLHNALELEPAATIVTPPEFEWEFADAWRLGYDHGTGRGEIWSQMLLGRIGRELTLP